MNYCTKCGGSNFVSFCKKCNSIESHNDCIRRECADKIRSLPCVNDNETEIRREDAIIAIIGDYEHD